MKKKATKKPLRIKKWLRTGNDSGHEKNTAQLLETAANALDAACASDIMGEIVFLGADGKYYVGTVEFVIGRANPAYIKDILAEDEACD